MTGEKLKKILSGGEGISAEFTAVGKSLPDNVFQSICAFLNRTGGDLLLGVADDGTVTGIDPARIDKIKSDLVNWSNDPDKLYPPFLLFPEEFTIGGKQIIYVRVPESSRVHETDDTVFDRNEQGDFKVRSGKAIRSMHQRKSANFSESKIYPRLELSDFSETIFPKVRNLIRSHCPDHPWLAISNTEMIESAGLHKRDDEAGKEGYTLAAALLFARDEVLQHILPDYKTGACLRGADPDFDEDRREIRTNLIDAYHELMQFIRAYLPEKFYQEGDIRVDLREKIFAEVVANMLIHREFASDFPARLFIYPDRVETENAGHPLGSGALDPDDFTSQPKNPTIAGFFQQLGLAGALGSGIRTIAEYLPRYAKNSRFELREGEQFKTIVYLASEEQSGVTKKTREKKQQKTRVKSTEVARERTREKIRKNTGVKTRGKTREKPRGKTREKIINAVLENPNVTTQELSNILNISAKGVEWQIARLKQEGVLKRIGPAKGGHWEIAE
jgi:ATP-dependent DNA helicase RecG